MTGQNTGQTWISARRPLTRPGKKDTKNKKGYMLLIYTDHSTIRLQYICRFIFKEQLGINYSITKHPESFRTHDGPRINYSHAEMPEGIFKLTPHDILFEKGIYEKQIEIRENNSYKYFFEAANSSFDFDLLAASFYLISRYEEYLPHQKDSYGRYAHENSLAFREGFLQQPLVNIWIRHFGERLQHFFPELKIMMPGFKYKLSYDIDIAWSYKNKGLIRNLGGFFLFLYINRLKVISGVSKDPYDSYEFLDQLHEENKIDPLYFFLVATTRSRYDKNISPYAHSMWQLIRRHSKKYRIGLHPSWRSNSNPTLVKKEKKILETAGNTPIHFSRQHYIYFDLPSTMENLEEAGITDDFSMGYGSINGFRASVASSFYWYNLSLEKISNICMHPFCFMDANSFYEQKQNAEDSYDEMMHYYQTCKKYGLTFICIFHNQFLGTDPLFKGWREIYLRFIAQLPK